MGRLRQSRDGRKGLFAPTLSAEMARRQDQTGNDLERFNPFITNAFLNALETSKSVGPRSGWTSAHILVKDAGGRLAAAAPVYEDPFHGHTSSIMTGPMPITARA